MLQRKETLLGVCVLLLCVLTCHELLAPVEFIASLSDPVQK